MRLQFSSYLLAILAMTFIVSAYAQPTVRNQAFENWKGTQAKSYQSDIEHKLR
jgi:hypothetical protein